jgi:hypothetical protein
MELFQSALRRGTGSANGVGLSTLARYLVACTATGAVDANELKAAIREGLDRMPQRGGHRRGFIMMLPGIDTESPLDEIPVPDPQFPEFD